MPASTKGVHPFVTYLKNRHYSYGRFQEEEGVPTVTGFMVEDVAALPRKTWPRFGGSGTFINLSEQEIDDAYVLEIPPKGVLRPQHHLFEEIVYVLSGQGSTSIWQGDGTKTTFEWHEGSLFSIPLNVHYQHANADGADAALLLGVTSAPLVINLYHNRDFVFNCPYVFTDRFDGSAASFDREPTLRDDVPGRLWEAYVLPDVRKIGLREWATRGRGFSHAYIALAGNVMKTHVAQFAVGSYKKAHRHGPGAHILILDGSGYSLMWKPGDAPQRYDWKPGSLISPPANWFHQHFNTGPAPVLHLAFHRPASIHNKNERAQIEYEDEDPAIRAAYVEELRAKGIQLMMER